MPGDCGSATTSPASADAAADLGRTGRIRVLVLGGGFAGLGTATRLERTLSRRDDVEVTLVNEHNYFLYTPMLHEIAGSEIDLTHAVVAMRRLLRRVRFVEGRVDAIDLAGRSVTVTRGIDRDRTLSLAFDHLVIALGSVTRFSDGPGIAGRALTMKTLGDAIRLRNRMIECLEEADIEEDASRRGALLGFVIAGGGFSGTETAASMIDFLESAARLYPRIDTRAIRVVLVHHGAEILPELDAALGRYAADELTRRRIEIRCGATVTAAANGAVGLSDGSSIEAGTLLWTAGSTVNPALDKLPCTKRHGRILTDRTLCVADWPGVWAAGDCAAVPDGEGSGFYPPTAQHAHRQARVLARNIAAAVDGRPLEPFAYNSLGTMATLGRRKGVATIGGVRLAGFPAWAMWRAYNLVQVPSPEKRLRIGIDWMLDLAFRRDLVGIGTDFASTFGPPDTEEAP